MESVIDSSAKEPRAPGRGRIAGEMGRALSSIRNLRGFLWVLAVLGAISCVGPLTADGTWTAGRLVVSFVCFAFTGFLVTAALRVESRPIFWTVATAVLLTALDGFCVARWTFPGSIPLIANVLAWVAVPRAIALERLLKEHPDLRFSRRLVKGGVAPHTAVKAKVRIEPAARLPRA